MKGIINENSINDQQNSNNQCVDKETTESKQNKSEITENALDSASREIDFRKITIKDLKKRRLFIVSLGVIDYLQEYDTTKQLENKFKSFFSFNSENSVSCVDPA